MRHVRRFAALSRQEQFALVVAVVLLPVVRLSLAVAGFTGTWRWCTAVGRRRTLQADAGHHAAMAESTMRMVRLAAARSPCPVTCLPTALAAWLILRWQGMEPVLRFGAGKHAGRVIAHAWLNVGGQWLDTANARDEALSPFERPDVAPERRQAFKTVHAPAYPR